MLTTLLVEVEVEHPYVISLVLWSQLENLRCAMSTLRTGAIAEDLNTLLWVVQGLWLKEPQQVTSITMGSQETFTREMSTLAPIMVGCLQQQLRISNHLKQECNNLNQCLSLRFNNHCNNKLQHLLLYKQSIQTLDLTISFNSKRLKLTTSEVMPTLMPFGICLTITTGSLGIMRCSVSCTKIV